MKTQSNEKQTTNGKNKSGNNGGRPSAQFIKYRLTEKELDAARDARPQDAELVGIVQQLTAEGYKFSASYDSYGGGIQVFITPTSPDSPNAGFTLSARAPDLLSAVGVLLYKHYTLFSQEWPADIPDQKTPAWG